VLKRVICVNTPNFTEVMFNPVILKRLKPITGTEGCLSFPGMLKDIKRSSKIHVKWVDRRGKSKYSEVTGLAARAIQHECDHLNGKTFDTYGETL
jgi:peptide deformylase